MSDYQLNVIGQVWILIIFYPIVSAIYYINSKSITQSAHGLLALFGFIYAVIACDFTDHAPAGIWYVPIYVFLFLSLASTAYSYKAFKGKKFVHLIHGVTIVANLLTAFVSLMAVAHDWI